MNPQRLTRIRPVGKHRDRLVENIGQPSWLYRGAPVRHFITQHGKRVDVWLFQWHGIPADVQRHMARTRASTFNCSVKVAYHFLETHPSAIPCDQVELIPE